MIAFTCPGCAKAFKVKEEFAGRKTKCPKCNTVIRVPTRIPTPPLPPIPAPANTPVPKLMPCNACGQEMAIAAAACPKCGAPNNWQHPEIQRLASSIQQDNFLPAQSHVFWKGYRVWGTGMKKHPGQDRHPMNWGPKLMIVSILVGIFGGIVNMALIAIAPILFFIGFIASLVGMLSDTVPVDQCVEFELDFSFSPPRWNCNDEDYWADVRQFFNV